MRKNHVSSLYRKKVEKIHGVALSGVSDNELRASSRRLMEQALAGEELDDLLIEAFALVKEAAIRTIGIEAYDEQLLAGIAMHEGNLVEMQTGEGKTLAAVFPAYLNALTGKGVDIFTYNDYLARRDAALMGPIYSLLGLTVGFVQENWDTQDRKRAYGYDITYVTAKEAGFDYLRNYLCDDKEKLIQRSFHYIIIDEADSLLIDEARIPLVIAAGGRDSADNQNRNRIREVILKLQKGRDYELDDKAQNVRFTNDGIDFIENELTCGNLYAEENLQLLSQLLDALQAEVLFRRDIDYIVRDGKIELVDEFTGRVADNRHWQDGIQAAVETKEALSLKVEGRIMNQITLQYFIMLHKKISGMTGTATDAENELLKLYHLTVVEIPTHKRCIRKDHPNSVFTHKEAKYSAIFGEIEKVHQSGQPILIGTASIRESEYVAEELKKIGIDSQVLNAKNDELEAHIIEQAGTYGAVTVSTNMAGRGTDIKLGGQDMQDYDRIVKLGGLYIIGTNIYESHRIEKQLKGRAGRQGDPGESHFFVSLEDDLIIKYGVENIIGEGNEIVQQETVVTDDDIVEGIEHLRRIVQGKNTDLRQWLHRYSYIIEQQKLLVQNRRMEILLDVLPSDTLTHREPELYSSLCAVIDPSFVQYLEKRVALFYIDHCWSDYLEYILDIRDISYLAVLNGKNPIDKFEVDAVAAFGDFQDRVAANIVAEFKNLELTADGIRLLLSRMASPDATFTYLLKENSYDGSLAVKLNRVGGTAFALMFAAPLVLLKRLYQLVKK